MQWFSGIVTYVIIWWMVLFCVLPWGNRPPEAPEVGHATSAPEKPRLLLKFGVTTLIATLLFFVAWWIIESDLIRMRP